MKKSILLLLLCALLSLAGCKREGALEKETYGREEKHQRIFQIDGLGNGDAKLADKNTVVTSIGSSLTFIKNGEIAKQYEDIHVNWLDTVREERLIVYSNWDKEVGILRYDENFNIISNDICLKESGDLGIDPCLCRAGSVYYITVTHIEGVINNGDINGENGKYTVSLYKTENLKNWEKVSDIITMNNNLEDGDLNFFHGKLYFTYEKEECDKGRSSINLLISQDGGLTFSDNITLVEENADNEPAGIIYDNETYYLFYSSDKENKGKSYEGANMYMQSYGSDFTLRDKPVKLECEYGEGTLFYDMLWEKDNLYCLFAGNYITQNNLVLEKLYLNR